jgi:poly-gamma-glutamate capsule biosynthesis protein CapA/YwtB (metallophosphatase superfamily)
MTVDGGSPHRPRSFLLLFTFYFLLFTLSSCLSHPPAVSLALLGDIILDRGVSPTSASLAYLAPELRRADLALANLESPLGEDDRTVAATGGYDLCTPASRAPLLADWGLDLISLANNHALDCAPDGLAQTRAALESAGLAPLLPNSAPVYRTVRGLRLAFLAFDDVSAPVNTQAAVGLIRAARGTGAVVTVAVHWGNEYQGGADDRQKSLARQFAAAGAALVWATHPHVIQPAEWIQTGGEKTLVLYSLGNTLFDQPGLADTRRSALVLVKVSRDGIQSARSVPFVIDVVHSLIVAPDDSSAAIIHERLHLP